MSEYDDIINLPRFISKNRHHMSNHDRAAQFAPFAALTGYDDSLKESIRVTDELLKLNEDETIYLDLLLMELERDIEDKPKIRITYFIYDQYKDGGSYIDKTINIRKIDFTNRQLITIDNEKYNLDQIIDIVRLD